MLEPWVLSANCKFRDACVKYLDIISSDVLLSNVYVQTIEEISCAVLVTVHAAVAAGVAHLEV